MNYKAMANELTNGNYSIDVQTENGTQKVSLAEAAYDAVIRKGYVTEEQLDAIMQKPVESLTEQEKGVYSEYISEFVAHETEILLGNEQFIDKIVKKQPSLARKVIEKIFHIDNAFKQSGMSKAEYKQLQKAERLYLAAAEKAGAAQLIKYIQGRIREEEMVDETEGIRYNRKINFLHKNFPTEKESGSEAHRLAVWWARNTDIQTGDQTLISMNDRWYLVEKFADTLNQYQVEGFISKEKFEMIYKEIKENGRSGKIRSIQRSFSEYDKLNKQRYSDKGREPSIDSLETEYNKKDSEVVRVDKSEVERGERPSNNGNGDSKGGGSNQQRYSLKDNPKKTFAALSDGEVKKLLANFTQRKWRRRRI